MYCSKCGTQNPDDSQSCNACGAVLSPVPPAPPEPIMPKTSGLAIASLVLGILSIFTCALTAIPSIICGIISLIKIEKSGGRLTGKGFAISGIILPVVTLPILLMAILMPALSRVRQTAFRMVCGTNLSGLSKAMMLYANDFDDEFPRAGSRTTRWSGKIADWQASNRFEAYGMTPDNKGGIGGTATITSNFYLLVKYSEVTPKSFVCKSDTGVTEFNPGDEGSINTDITSFWDFGPNPRQHCSYSYHMPYGQFALTTSSEPGLAVAADRNPWEASPSGKARDFASSGYNPNGGTEAVKAGNSPSHQGDGQNVLFLDLHVAFEKTPVCGINDDNIYTFQDGSDVRIGSPPVPYVSQPQTSADSLLVNDGR
jgi:hypothetical protein